MRRLDLGCGSNKPEGCVGLDKYPYPCVDIVRDIDRHGLPFDSDSVDEVRASHFLEHCYNLVFVMNEIYRVLKRGGRLTIIVPIVEQGTGAFRDPSHVRYFNKDSFHYFTEDSPYVQPFHGIRPFYMVRQEVNGEILVVELEKP